MPSPFPDTPEGRYWATNLSTSPAVNSTSCPSASASVVTLRDMLGLGSREVCELLDISMANQRVLLHRGRAAVRQVLEDYVVERS